MKRLAAPILALYGMATKLMKGDRMNAVLTTCLLYRAEANGYGPVELSNDELAAEGDVLKRFVDDMVHSSPELEDAAAEYVHISEQASRPINAPSIIDRAEKLLSRGRQLSTILWRAGGRGRESQM